ncbi:hypothetical protein HPMBJEAJ_00034 [Aeromonas phage avDM6]|nr:hypothetical protein HPMBJEAJ_00034 [Aeromonas phage avDM6]
MSHTKIKPHVLEKAVNNYFQINEVAKKMVDKRLAEVMAETKVVGWFFKRTVNKVAYDEDHNPFSQPHIIKFELMQKLREALSLKSSKILNKVYEYKSMCDVCPSGDFHDQEIGFIYADEEMCWFIDHMNKTNSIVVEKAAAKLWWSESND